MPYESDAQRRFMHAKHPEIAAKWDAEIRGKKKGHLKKSADIFKSEDPDFNYKAAQETFDLVMKMEPDEAEMFAHFVVSEVLEDTIEKNLKTLQRRLNQVVAKRIDQVRVAVEKAAEVSKSADSAEYLKALEQWEEISKINPYDYGYRFQESDFNRDPGSGQFKTKIKHTTTRPMYSDKQAEELGIPMPKNKKGTKTKALPDKVKAQYQEEYHQLANFLGNVHSASPEPGSNRIILQLQDKNTHERYDVMASVGTDPKEAASRYSPEDAKLVGVVARPGTLNVGGAAFGLQRALGGDPTGGFSRGVNAVDQNFGDFSEGFVAPGDKYNSNARTYNRIHAGSQLLSAVGTATQNPHIATAAALGQFVGSHGAEAEAVFGPPTRKMAYRYRGTEKTPDKELVSEYGRAVHAAKMRDMPQGAMMQMAQRRVTVDKRPPTKDEALAARGVLVQYLSPLNKERRPYTPDKKLLNLHLAAGNTPPSEGILLNKEGQIVSQAVGYGDDHYLPFNLKNLKPLKGGSYIRTRSVGGLTTEDIYTGLMAGAGSVTVVSRSGVFTVDFAEDFRGGRRHNDKAKRMVRRYEQILDAVQSEQVESSPVPQEVKQALTQQVKAEYEGSGVSPTQIRRLIDEKVKEYQVDPDISAPDSALENLIIHNGEAAGRDAVQYRNTVRSLLAENRERTWKLNARGYEAAQRVLQEQFPYYLTATAVPLREDESDVKTDPGYVKPGRNRPTMAQAGLFLGDKEGKGEKFSAEEADFQGVRNRAKTGSKDSIPRPPGVRGTPPRAGFTASATEGAASGEERPETEGDKQKKVIEENRKKIVMARTATKLWEEIKAIPGAENAQGPLGEMIREYQAIDTEGEFQQKFNEDPKKFHDHAVQLSKVPGQLPGFKQAFTAYSREFGRSTATEWDPVKAKIPGTTFTFKDEGRAFTITGDKADRTTAMGKIDQKHGKSVTADRFPSMMSEAEIETEINFLTEIAQLTTGITGEVEVEGRKDFKNTLGIQQDSPQLTKLFDNPSKEIDKKLKEMHKAKALRKLGLEPNKAKQSAESKATQAAATKQPEGVPRPEENNPPAPPAPPQQGGGGGKPRGNLKEITQPEAGRKQAVAGALPALDVLLKAAEDNPDQAEEYFLAADKLEADIRELQDADDPEQALKDYRSATVWANIVTKADADGVAIPKLKDDGTYQFPEKPKT